MIKKRYKLTGKDINFLLKKQNIIYSKYFLFFRYPQYKNRKYNQFGVQIPVKLTKKAVMRNQIKRIIYNYIKNNNLVEKTGKKNKYYKIFILLNKKQIPNIQKTIETNDKKVIKNKIKEFFAFSFNNVHKELGKKPSKH